jgi:hypothetical protein
MRWALIALMCVWSTVSAAQDRRWTGNLLLPACKTLLNDDNGMDFLIAYNQGICMGSVQTLAVVAKMVPGTVCAPQGVTTGQTVRVIIAFLEARPQRLNEDFSLLAVEAVRDAWPCKK